MSSGMNFFNTENTPRNDRENLQQAHSTKSNTGFGRIHLRPKTAFGELQNVIHNETPMKGSLKPQAFTSSPFEPRKNANVLAPIKRLRTIPAQEREHLECVWLEDSLMTVSEFKKKIKKKEEEKKKQREDEWEKLGEDLIRALKQKPVKIFDNDVDELCVLEPPCLTAPSIPDLPLDDLDTDDFFKW